MMVVCKCTRKTVLRAVQDTELIKLSSINKGSYDQSWPLHLQKGGYCRDCFETSFLSNTSFLDRGFQE